MKRNHTSKEDLSRRDFIKTTAVGLGATALTGLGANEVEAASPPQNWDYEADVVVVGYGAAGAAASISAHDAGAEVLLLEKAPEQFKGGNSRVSANAVAIPDDVEKMKVYFKGLCEPSIDHMSADVFSAFAQETYNNKAWLAELGADIKQIRKGGEFPELQGAECIGVYCQKGIYGGARLWDEVIEPAVASRGIRILYETPAKRLIRSDDGEILGVVAGRGVREVNIKAKRATILACGGFENNQTYQRNYLADMPYCYPKGTPFNTGDGIRMALGVGADLWHMSNMCPEFCFKAPEYDTTSYGPQVKGKSYIYVARDAARFMAEDPVQAERHGWIYDRGHFTSKPPLPLPIFIVFDEPTRAAGGIFGKGAGYAFGWDVIYDVYKWSADNSKEVEKGWIKQADTVRGLAEKTNLNADALEATVQRFNEGCAAGKDLDYDRKPQSLAPIMTPPFYILEMVPATGSTGGGPVRNENAQIIDAFSDPIPRLYSAGELGSFMGYRPQGGLMFGQSLATGRIAGRNAAAEAPW